MRALTPPPPAGLWLLRLLAPALLLVACSGDDPGPSSGNAGPGDTPTPTTPVVSDHCQGSAVESCPCPAEGTKAACGEIAAAQEGQPIMCSHGTATCEGGRWSPCAVESTTALVREAPGLEAFGLGQATKCSGNPCDPYCQQFPDTPQGSGNSGTGIVETPGGLSLPSTDAPLPAALCSGNFRSCSHALCTTGTKLTAGCDALNLPCATRTRNGRTYMICGDSKSWPDAQAACVAQGLQLATMNDSAENAWVLSQALTVSGSSWWVGFNDRKTEGNFVWADGALASFLNWSAGEPNDSGNDEDCTQLYSNGTWNDLSCGAGLPYICEGVPAAGGCVASVCAQRPSCCSGQWDATCITLAKSQCSIDCAVGSQGECITCFKDGADHDGDGYSYQQGDCLDCDPQTNPGAYDFPNNGSDEDCSGTADDEPTGCDTGLPLTSTSGVQHAKAMDLCRATTDAATGSSRTWGVVDAKIVQADAVQSPATRQYGILDHFGTTTATDTFGLPTNGPRQGARMTVFSSGAARNPTESLWVNPNGTAAGNNNTYAVPPSGFPKNAKTCSNGTAAYDSAGLWMRVRVPTNVQSFNYRFNFFSSEYPEWVCTSYNDSFIALLNSAHPTNVANLSGDNKGNISFDSVPNPVSVNVGFFSVPGSPSGSSPKLNGTGFDGLCPNNNNGKYDQICGGATDWLKTQAPVLAGETVTMQFSIWDTGDHIFDSTVLIDNWAWSSSPSGIKTAPELPPAPPKFTEGSFIRDYDATGICPSGTSVAWGLWTWSTDTPTDTSVEYYFKAANSAAELATATEWPLVFTSPQGPAGLVGQNAVAKASTGTQAGALVVGPALKAHGLLPTTPVVRVRSRLRPSSDQYQAPTLKSWNLQIDCLPSE